MKFFIQHWKALTLITLGIFGFFFIVLPIIQAVNAIIAGTRAAITAAENAAGWATNPQAKIAGAIYDWWTGN